MLTCAAARGVRFMPNQVISVEEIYTTKRVQAIENIETI